MPDMTAIFLEAVAAYNARRHGEAERICRVVLEQEPRHFDALRLLGLVQHCGGACAAALASHDLALAIRPGHAETLSNRGNVLKDLKRSAEALASYEAALRSDPDHAEAHYNRAVLLKDLGRLDEALADYAAVLRQEPDHTEALNNSGNIMRLLRRPEQALAFYDRALATRPDYVEAFNNRGVALHEIGRYDDALGSFDAAIIRHPAYGEAFINRAIVLKALRRFDEALSSCRRALDLAPDNADAHWHEALLRLLIGDLAAGFAKYEWRWRRAAFTSPRRDFVVPQWDGRVPLHGKAILLHAEQGFGDAIQFCRYVPQVAARGARIILEIAEPLRRLFGTLDGGAEIVCAGARLPAFDLHCPLASLPLAFGTTLATVPAAIPYLHPPAETVAAWEALLDGAPAPRIGLVWSGNPHHHNDRNRSLALEAVLPLAALDASFMSLQKELRPGDAELLERHGIRHLGGRLRDFSDAAALISRLDAVVSVDTSLAHLAGALGKPVFVLIPHTPDWRWLLGRSTSPWYPTARLVRQPAPGAWSEAVIHLAGELARFIGVR
jgi:tetratricopeptide (TPR) repeat protein